MRCLIRNMRKFKYATYISSEDVVNDGVYSGETNTQYSEPVVAYANITAATGAADVEPYGTRMKYDKTLVMERLPEGFDEHAVLWIDDLDAELPDYVVLRISESLNFVTIGAMRKDRA